MNSLDAVACGKLSNFFENSFSACRTDPVSASRDELLLEIRRAVAAILQTHWKNEFYEPIYGVDEFSRSGRREILLQNCAAIIEYFRGFPLKHQLRILDVGANAGFVSLRLSEVFPKVIGLDVLQDLVLLCRNLASYIESPAQFYRGNFLEMIENGIDIHSVDVLLILNVTHYFVTTNSLEYLKKLMARLTKAVTFVFIQLARLEDYPFLPSDPAEIFQECDSCEISLLRSGGRPLYVVRARGWGGFGSRAR